MNSEGADRSLPSLQRGGILLVANFAPDVGFAWWLMERFWLRYDELAAVAGRKATIVYPVTGPLPELTRRSGVETEILPFPGRGFHELWASLRLLRKRRIRVIYFTDRPFTHGAYALFRLVGVRRILVHDHTPGDRPASRGLKGGIKWLWRRLPWVNADTQICVSPLIAERAVQNARIPRDRTVVVQNGIDATPCSDDREYAKRQFGLPSHARLCVTVARASVYKRIDFIIEVARICRSRGLEDLYFLHCGDGPDLERFQELAEAAGVADRVRFAGRRTDVEGILCSADFALHPSRGEAFSLSVIEYMRAGLVLLVPDIPSVAQAVDDGQTGIVYPDGDAEAVARQLSELMAAPERCQRIGQAARAAVVERYSSTQMMAQFDDAVRSTVSSLATN
jgi:glycosyltransferase involved in cell wall biosynthesis